MSTEDMKIYHQDMIRKNYENYDKLYNAKKVMQDIDCQQIAHGWGTTNIEGIKENVKDGRSSSFYVELSICDIYNLTHNPDKNGLYDASIKINNNLITEVFIGIKTLSKNGLDLMQSGFKGRALKMDNKTKVVALSTSIALMDYHIIVDIVDAPRLYYSPVKSTKLLSLLIYGSLPFNLKRSNFYNILFGKSLEDLLREKEFESFTFKSPKSWSETKGN